MGLQIEDVAQVRNKEGKKQVRMIFAVSDALVEGMLTDQILKCPCSCLCPSLVQAEDQGVCPAVSHHKSSKHIGRNLKKLRIRSNGCIQ